MPNNAFFIKLFFEIIQKNAELCLLINILRYLTES